MEKFNSITYVKFLALATILEGADEGIEYEKKLLELLSEIYDDTTGYVELMEIMKECGYEDFNEHVLKILDEIEKAEKAREKEEKGQEKENDEGIV